MAEEMPYSYLRLDPALPAYLKLGQSDDTLRELAALWADAMRQLVSLLYKQSFKDSTMAAQLTLLELPNLMILLDSLLLLAEADQTIIESVSGTVRMIEQLFDKQGQPQATAKAAGVRAKLVKYIPEWGRARFESEHMLIEQLQKQGQLKLAFEKTQSLLAQAQSHGAAAYQDADYDLAMANWLMGKMLKVAGQAETAINYLITALQLFEALGSKDERMTAVCLTEQADCLRDLGQLEKAVEKYKESIDRAKNLEDSRQVAVGKGQLANVLREQGKYQSAITEYKSSKSIFEQLNEPNSVAIIWHQIGMVYGGAGAYGQAESAYRQSLEIQTQHNNLAGQANSLNVLGNLYGSKLNRLEEAITFYRQATDIYVQLGDLRYEGAVRNNIAGKLIKLEHYDQARTEILRAIECDSQFGHTAVPWKTFNTLQKIETAQNKPKAANSAWQKATQAYLAYRQQGGYAQYESGKFADAILDLIKQNKSVEAIALLTEYTESAEAPDWFKKVAAKMRLVVKGQKKRALADDFDLDFDDAAEILFLIERL